MGKKADNLNAIGWELKGEDADLWVELPDAIEVGACSGADYDAIGACYETDDERGGHFAVFCVVVHGNTPPDACTKLVERVQSIADEILGWESGPEVEATSDQHEPVGTRRRV